MEQSGKTDATFKKGSGGKKGKLAGLEIPYERGVAHGETALNPVRGLTSAIPMVPSRTGKMFVGLAFSILTVESEWFHEIDASRGNLPEGESTNYKKVLNTYVQHQNWYAIGQGNGGLAYATSSGGTGTHTFAFDNTARGRSKGSIRLAVSGDDPAQRIYYESIDESVPGGVVTSTFYITSKPSALTANLIITDAGTIGAGDLIVKKGHYNRVKYGLGYHINHLPRLYQGADTSVDDFLNSIGIDGKGGPLTATLIDTAKLAQEIEANDEKARKNRMFHLTHGHHRSLASYGYDLRAYNAEKGQAKTSYGVPRDFEDEDSNFRIDENMEDAYVYARRITDYWYYTQSELREVTSGKGTVARREHGQFDRALPQLRGIQQSCLGCTWRGRQTERQRFRELFCRDLRPQDRHSIRCRRAGPWCKLHPPVEAGGPMASRLFHSKLVYGRTGKSNSSAISLLAGRFCV